MKLVITKSHPACHPREEKTSHCDVFDANFQKHGTIDVLFESARYERDFAAV